MSLDYLSNKLENIKYVDSNNNEYFPCQIKLNDEVVWSKKLNIKLEKCTYTNYYIPWYEKTSDSDPADNGSLPEDRKLLPEGSDLDTEKAVMYYGDRIQINYEPVRDTWAADYFIESADCTCYWGDSSSDIWEKDLYFYPPLYNTGSFYNYKLQKFPEKTYHDIKIKINYQKTAWDSWYHDFIYESSWTDTGISLTGLDKRFIISSYLTVINSETVNPDANKSSTWTWNNRLSRWETNVAFMTNYIFTSNLFSYRSESNYNSFDLDMYVYPDNSRKPLYSGQSAGKIWAYWNPNNNHLMVRINVVKDPIWTSSVPIYISGSSFDPQGSGDVWVWQEY